MMRAAARSAGAGSGETMADRIEVSVEELASALEDAEFVIRNLKPCDYGSGETASVRYPTPIARGLLQHIAAHREPEPDVTRDLTVTGRQIADALEGLPVEVEVEPGVAKSPKTGGWLAVIEGTVSKPGAVAAAILTQVPGFGEPRASDGTVSLTMQRDHLLEMIGWVNAHRPVGEWEPGFVSRFLTAAGKAAGRDARD